jgi:acetyl-CoA carboxylase carboxyl transferase subunit alpha
MGITAQKLHERGLVDEIVPEPLGAAHRDPGTAADALKDALLRTLGELEALSTNELLAARYARLRAYGQFEERE